MGIASFVLGIVSLLFGCVPFCGVIMLIPCVIGIILGIIAIATNNQRGFAISGLLMSILAIIFFFLFTVGVVKLNEEMSNTSNNTINNVM